MQRPTVAPPMPPAGAGPAPGYQCELCKSARAAVRCDRCDHQVFCLQCDDIFHRHPKRKSHLRKSVEQREVSLRPPQATSAVTQMPGHTVVASKPFWKQQPSAQPNIPPRKKKPFSILTNLMRGKSEAAIPEEIEKRGTISSKLGSLKRFIQNRPLPSLPGEATPSSNASSSYPSGDEPKRNAFESLHNRRTGSTSSLARNNNKDLSDWEDNGLLGSNLQVNRMYSPQTASINRHQSMMDLSRMAAQGCPGMPYLGHPAPFGVLPYGAPYPGMPGVPYGSMSYLNDPRMMAHPWGYAGSTGSFSNLNSSAEGEGKDTDTESTARLAIGGHLGAMADPRMASMRRCQSYAANQWGTMMYPQPPGPAPFGYPMGMVPFPGYPGGSQWGSGQSIESTGMMPPTNANSQLSNMDANRAIWYYHNRNKQRPIRADTETSDSDLDFIPRSSRSRTDSRQVTRHPSQGDIPRQSPHGARLSRSNAALHSDGRRAQRADDSRDSRQSSPRPCSTRASSVGASDSNMKDYSYVELHEQRHNNSQSYHGAGRQPLSGTPHRSNRDSPPPLPVEEYIDPSSLRQRESPARESRPKERDRGVPAVPRRSSYERATRDDFEQTPGNRSHSSQPMSPPRHRQNSVPSRLEPSAGISRSSEAAAAPRLPEKKLSGKLATPSQSNQSPATADNKATSRDAESTRGRGTSAPNGNAGGTAIVASHSSRTTFSPERNFVQESDASTPGRSGASSVPTNDSEPGRFRWSPSKQWTCIHCTFINAPGVKICSVCCKTSFKDPSPEQAKKQEDESNDHQEVFGDPAEAEQTPKDTPAKTSSSTAKKPPSKRAEPARASERASNARTSNNKEVDGFDYDFIKQQREVEQELRRRLENERRIAAENARLEAKSTVKENLKAAGGSSGRRPRDASSQGTNGGLTPCDAYEVVEFTSEAESETESGRDVENRQYPKARNLASRFEDKIKLNKEGSPTTGPYRRMMVDQNGEPKALSSIGHARSRFESGQTSDLAFSSRPRKSSLKGSDLTPSSSRSSLSSEKQSPKPRADRSSELYNTSEYQEYEERTNDVEDCKDNLSSRSSSSSVEERRRIGPKKKLDIHKDKNGNKSPILKSAEARDDVEVDEEEEAQVDDEDEAEVHEENDFEVNDEDEDDDEGDGSSGDTEGMSENSQEAQTPPSSAAFKRNNNSSSQAIKGTVQQTVAKERPVARSASRQAKARPSKGAPTTEVNPRQPSTRGGKETSSSKVGGKPAERDRNSPLALAASPKREVSVDSDSESNAEQPVNADNIASMAMNLKARSFRSVADLVEEQRRELEKENALQLMNAIKEGEEAGFSAEDVQIARTLCGDANPVFWLQTNWAHIIETVIHLSNSYVAENALENVGQLSVLEAQAALRRQRGNVWNSVVDAVERRQAAFQEIASKGPFKSEDILQELRSTQGNVDQAVAQLSNNAMNAFLVKMYAGSGPASASGDMLSRASSENTVAADEKIAFWLRNAKPPSNSGSSMMSSSSESINLLAGPDQQLHKLDQLMMKRHMQKKEETRYKKYKERVAHARQHHEGAMVAETGYFEKNLRPSSSMSASSLEPASSVTSKTTNIEEVIEQRIQSGISTILSAIETTLKKDKDSVVRQQPSDGEVKEDKRGCSKALASSTKSSRRSESESDYGEEDHNDNTEEATSKARKDISDGRVSKPEKAGKATSRCRAPSPERKTTDTESEPEGNEGTSTRKQNPLPKTTSKRSAQDAKKSNNTNSKNSIGENHDAVDKVIAACSKGPPNISSVGSTTEDSDVSDDKDYSEVELAMATITQATVVSPFEVHVNSTTNVQDSDDSEEFEEASEFLDLPTVQGPEIIHHEEAPELNRNISIPTSSVTPDPVNEVVVVKSVAVRSGTSNTTIADRKIVKDKADQSNQVEGATRVNTAPEETNGSLKVTTDGPALPTHDALLLPIVDPSTQLSQEKESQNFIADKNNVKSDNAEIQRSTNEHKAPQLQPIKEPENQEGNQNNDSVFVPTEPQMDNLERDTENNDSEQGESKKIFDTSSPNPIASGEVEEAPIFHSSELTDSGAADFDEDIAVHEHINHTSPIDDPADGVPDNIGQAAHEILEEEIIEENHTQTMDEFLAQEDAYWAEQDRLEQEYTDDDNQEEYDEEDEEVMDNLEAHDEGLYEEEYVEFGENLGEHERVTEESPGNGIEEDANFTLNLANERIAWDMAATEDPHVVSFVLHIPSAQRPQPSGATSVSPSEEPLDESDLAQAAVPAVEPTGNTDADVEVVVPISELPANITTDDQTPNDSVDRKSKPIKKKIVKRKISSNNASELSTTLVNGSSVLDQAIGTPNDDAGVPDPRKSPESPKQTRQTDGHDSNDYSDVSDDDTETGMRRPQGNLAGQTVMMKVLRRSLEDLARLGGKPQKVASKHVVYRRPSIRRRSTIVVVDQGDGFGRLPGGDAIIIKPQRGLERALRMSGQDLTKESRFARWGVRRPRRWQKNGRDASADRPELEPNEENSKPTDVQAEKTPSRGTGTNGERAPTLRAPNWLISLVKRNRAQPPPRRRIQDATILQEDHREPVSPIKQKQYNEKARELVHTGAVDSMAQAQMVAELVDMNFDQDDAILASANTDSVYQAVLFLQQDCNICVGTYPMSQMVALLQCAHVACRECLRTYFTIQIREHNIGELRCPFCREPDLGDEMIEQNYFSNMSVLLKDLLDKDTFELFQKKLVERALMKDPNFRWCPQCSSGFITVAQQRMVTCPDCNTSSCANCKKTWRKEHESLSCEDFDVWLSRAEPDSAEKALEAYFEENGIQCPECKFRYALSRGGCMHFKCIQCGFDFCSGCNRPYRNGDKCGFSVNCPRMGLHAHHPRHCLFYLRDKEHNKLETLLKDAGVPIKRDPPPGQEKQKHCPIPESKETALGGYKDDVCGRTIEPQMGGICRRHYIEYLGGLIFRNKIDPWPILEIEELELCIRRANMRLPSKYQMKDTVYKDVLRKIVREDIPLDKVDPKQK